LGIGENKMKNTNTCPHPWSELFFDWPKDSPFTWKKELVTIKDGKARFNTPGANRENLSVSFVDGVLELSWPGVEGPSKLRYTITSGIEPVEAEVKDGITTISFNENKKTISVK
jgi:hypothetical protein